MEKLEYMHKNSVKRRQAAPPAPPETVSTRKPDEWSTRSNMSGKACRLNRSMQHHVIH
jgi:hypothetical protein